MAPGWVLTAAHCIRKRLFVLLGEHDLVIHEVCKFVCLFTIFMPCREVAVIRTDVYGVGRRREGKVFRHFSRRYFPNFARSVSAYRDQPVLGGRCEFNIEDPVRVALELSPD